MDERDLNYRYSSDIVVSSYTWQVVLEFLADKKKVAIRDLLRQFKIKAEDHLRQKRFVLLVVHVDHFVGYLRSGYTKSVIIICFVH